MRIIIARDVRNSLEVIRAIVMGAMEYFTILSPASDTYHSRYACSHVPPDVRSNPNWEVSHQEPEGKKECTECNGWLTSNKWVGRNSAAKPGTRGRPG